MALPLMPFSQQAGADEHGLWWWPMPGWEARGEKSILVGRNIKIAHSTV